MSGRDLKNKTQKIMQNNRIAIVHDWFMSYTGSERCINALLELFPKADLYTLIYDSKGKGFEGTLISSMQIKQSFISKIPFAKHIYRNLLPIFPLAIEGFDLTQYDIVISSSHSVAHGVVTSPYSKHICYKYSPMRYLWSHYGRYLKDKLIKNPIKNFMARVFMHPLRIWDYAAAHRVDSMIAISKTVQRRIKKYYQIDSSIIYPPVEVEKFYHKSNTTKEDYYISLSRLVDYKNVDLIIRTFNKYMHNQKLVIVGDGPQKRLLQKLAKDNNNIVFTGFISNKEKIKLLQKAKALIFAANEDFGIAPVEAMASRTPVIAYGKGGATETVIKNKTGVFFDKLTPLALYKAIKDLDKLSVNPNDLHKRAKEFSKQEFQANFVKTIQQSVNM